MSFIGIHFLSRNNFSNFKEMPTKIGLKRFRYFVWLKKEDLIGNGFKHHIFRNLTEFCIFLILFGNFLSNIKEILTAVEKIESFLRIFFILKEHLQDISFFGLFKEFNIRLVISIDFFLRRNITFFDIFDREFHKRNISFFGSHKVIREIMIILFEFIGRYFTVESNFFGIDNDIIKDSLLIFDFSHHFDDKIGYINELSRIISQNFLLQIET